MCVRREKFKIHHMDIFSVLCNNDAHHLSVIPVETNVTRAIINTIHKHFLSPLQTTAPTTAVIILLYIKSCPSCLLLVVGSWMVQLTISVPLTFGEGMMDGVPGARVEAPGVSLGSLNVPLHFPFTYFILVVRVHLSLKRFTRYHVQLVCCEPFSVDKSAAAAK